MEKGAQIERREILDAMFFGMQRFWMKHFWDESFLDEAFLGEKSWWME